MDKSAQLTADVVWKSRMSDQLDVETAGLYRAFTGLYLERQDFQFNPQDCSFYAPVQIHSGVYGQIVGGSVAAVYRFRPQLTQRLFYSYQTAVAGDHVFKAVWKAIPKHKASYRLTTTPVENFTIWAMVSYLSSSTWVDYQNIEAPSCNVLPGARITYSSTVNSAFVVDLHFQKWFWHRRLLSSLLFRNLTNKKYRYHPIGASFDLSFFVKVTFFLHSQ